MVKLGAEPDLLPCRVALHSTLGVGGLHVCRECVHRGTCAGCVQGVCRVHAGVCGHVVTQALPDSQAPGRLSLWNRLRLPPAPSAPSALPSAKQLHQGPGQRLPREAASLLFTTCVGSRLPAASVSRPQTPSLLPSSRTSYGAAAPEKSLPFLCCQDPQTRAAWQEGERACVRQKEGQGSQRLVGMVPGSSSWSLKTEVHWDPKL